MQASFITAAFTQYLRGLQSVIKWMADARNSAHALMGDNATMQDLLHAGIRGHDASNALLSDMPVFTNGMLAGYDVVVRDAWYWPAAVLTAKLGLPAVDVMPTSFVQPNAQLYLQAPNPLAYVPQLEGTEVKVHNEGISVYCLAMCGCLQ